MFGFDISPCQLIQSGDVPKTTGIGAILVRRALPTNSIDGDQDGQDKDSHGNKDFKQHAQVAQEEVCIQPTFLNEFSAGSTEDGADPEE